jgi:hypothetical protein
MVYNTATAPIELHNVTFRATYGKQLIVLLSFHV